MSEHSFRNPERYGIDSMRAWIRKFCPGSSWGYVPIDGDLLNRTYGPNCNSDSIGQLMIVEKKENGAYLTNGERRVYDFINHGMLTGEYADRWRGCHKLGVQTSIDWPKCETCKQYIRTDERFARRIFCLSKLTWDNAAISHAQFRRILLNREIQKEVSHS